MKVCSICKNKLPDKAFYSDKRTMSGLYAACKKCHQKAQLKSRGDRTRYNRSMKEWREANNEKVKTFQRNWRKKNKHKAAAHSAVFMAIKKGELKKLPCTICGKKAEAHHPDYNKPLNVIWLCRFHHKAIHKVT
jgi:DNA-directed RNA polymerase subunit RPC12/RpoP